jgi:hypothetical protein
MRFITAFWRRSTPKRDEDWRVASPHLSVSLSDFRRGGSFF